MGLAAFTWWLKAVESAIAEITFKLHRASLMRKMGLRTVPELIRYYDLIQRQGV